MGVADTLEQGLEKSLSTSKPRKLLDSENLDFLTMSQPCKKLCAKPEENQGLISQDLDFRK